MCVCVCVCVCDIIYHEKVVYFKGYATVKTLLYSVCMYVCVCMCLNLHLIWRATCLRGYLSSKIITLYAKQNKYDFSLARTQEYNIDKHCMYSTWKVSHMERIPHGYMGRVPHGNMGRIPHGYMGRVPHGNMGHIPHGTYPTWEVSHMATWDVSHMGRIPHRTYPTWKVSHSGRMAGDNSLTDLKDDPQTSAVLQFEPDV